MGTTGKWLLALWLTPMLAYGWEAPPPGSTLSQHLCQGAIGLASAGDLDALVARSTGSRLVLLGESTHGTAEFYRWRAAVSQRLIAEGGFRFIAVEGDWASILRLNRYVKGLAPQYRSAAQVLGTFSRWPEWMWGNTEMAALAEWLKAHNSRLPPDERVGLYGMDVYGQWEAMESVRAYVREALPAHYPQVARAFGCFKAFGSDEWQYVQAVQRGHPPCAPLLEGVVAILQAHADGLAEPNRARELFYAKQSAKVVRNAEEHFRLSPAHDGSSWNSRATHMHATVTRLLALHGEAAQGIVWAHNTHVGDARATAMRGSGMVNIGQLSREHHGEAAVTLVGFTTYTGVVNAGSQWGSPMQLMRIPRAAPGSLEHKLNSCNLGAFYVVFDERMRQCQQALSPIGHRAIGVVFNPALERQHNYVPSIVPLRYDAMVFIPITQPLTPVSP